MPNALNIQFPSLARARMAGANIVGQEQANTLRGMQIEQMPEEIEHQRKVRERAISKWAFEDEKDALAYMKKSAPFITLDQYPAAVKHFTELGAHPDLFPPVEAFEGDPAKFEAWKLQILSSADARLKAQGTETPAEKEARRKRQEADKSRLRREEESHKATEARKTAETKKKVWVHHPGKNIKRQVSPTEAAKLVETGEWKQGQAYGGKTGGTPRREFDLWKEFRKLTHDEDGYPREIVSSQGLTRLKGEAAKQGLEPVEVPIPKLKGTERLGGLFETGEVEPTSVFMLIPLGQEGPQAEDLINTLITDHGYTQEQAEKVVQQMREGNAS